MSDNQLVIRNSSALMPAMGIQDAIARYNAVVDFTKQVMKADKDYGVIPGAGNKPTLLKPGAEKLCSLFGLAPKFSPLDHTVDFEKGLFYLQYECNLYRDGVMVGSGIGSCNSMEKKYRYRQGERVCPSCGKPTIIKGKQEYGGGFICFAKKGGCGAKFGDNDPAIVKQDIGQVENPDRADLLNTIDKMAQKRALVAAILITTNASEFFTQDIEDMTFIEGQFIDVTPSPVQATTRSAEIITELGFTEQPPANPVNMSAPEVMAEHKATMTIGEAMNETAEDGTTYGSMETPVLANRMNSMMKVKGTESAKPEHARKMAAIQMILKARKGK